MASPFHAVAYLSLPRLDAHGAITLAQAFESATLDRITLRPRPLPEAIAMALEELRQDRDALVIEIGEDSALTPEVIAVDQEEDTAVGAIHDALGGWARVAGRIPLGDLARDLRTRLFPDGIQFIHYNPRHEWAVVEDKLQTIAAAELEGAFAELGLLPLLEHLRAVHVRYGEVTGATRSLPLPDSSGIKMRLERLRDSLRYYVLAVVGSIKRHEPETVELAELLLAPLREWPRRPTRRRRDEG